MNYSLTPDITYTLESFVALSSKTVISYQALSFIEKINNNIQFPIKNVLDDYREEIELATVDVTLKDKDYIKYAYKPKLLAFDLYGSTELYFIILLANGICNIKEFNQKTIKLFKPDILNDLIESIYNANYMDIDTYNNS